MEFVAIEDARIQAWAVEAIDHDGDSEVFRTVFYGSQDKERAEEYAAWKNAQ